MSAPLLPYPHYPFTAHDTLAKQQALHALRLTDLIRLCLGTFSVPGFAATWQAGMKRLLWEMRGAVTPRCGAEERRLKCRRAPLSSWWLTKRRAIKAPDAGLSLRKCHISARKRLAWRGGVARLSSARRPRGVWAEIRHLNIFVWVVLMLQTIFQIS